MFPTFTGNSKRARNVNLSGQRPSNPWGASGWTSGPSGASQTVANAQVEREKRQRERDQIAASKRIQRVWRGHKTRVGVQNQRRNDWDELYDKNGRAEDRVTGALPLIAAFFNPNDPTDQARLDSFATDLADFGSPALEDRQWQKLTSILLAALEKRHISSARRLLDLLVDIIRTRPFSIASISDRYYKLVSIYCGQAEGRADSETVLPLDDQDRLAAAISAPLGRSSSESYEAFAFSFLTSTNLAFLRRNPAQIARFLDIQVLSHRITSGLTRHDRAHQHSRDDLLWLLAHFIAICHASPTSQDSAYLEALYQQLSELSADIRVRTNQDGDAPDDESIESEDKATEPLPPYVMGQLNSLVSDNGIAGLLSRFTSTAQSDTKMSEDASLLAGYILILLQCFPGRGDNIKLSLYQGDIATEDSTASGPVPSVQFLWKAVLGTGIFSQVAHKEAEQKSKIVVSLLQSDPTRNQEWRTVLLFLELYNFLLRVTDDEDFLPSESEVAATQSHVVSRTRSSGLSLNELKELVSFLKNLSFPLYYNLPDIMPSSTRSTITTVSTIFGSSNPGYDDVPVRTPSSFAGIQGMDVLTLRAVATATMRSLYERDSRRPFLKQGFWLMTSRFDMDGFLSAVVLEEQRKADADDEDEEMEEADLDHSHGFHTASGHRLSRAAHIERLRQHKRAQREKLLAQVGPKLEILRNMPFTIPFEVRVQIFRQFVLLDKQKRRGGHVDADQWRMSVLHGPFGQQGEARGVLGRHSATIKRGQVFEDAYDQFYPLGESLKEPIQITFVDQFDQQEAGIDGGGVTKEFLTSVTSEAFNPDHHGLFVTNTQNLLYPNPTAYEERKETLRYYGIPENSAEWHNRLAELSKQYEFLGRIVGKCMYEGILIDLAFASFFLLKWASSGQSSADSFRASLNDVRELDPDLYKGLINLKNYPGDVTDFALDFTINDRVTNPETRKVRTITRPLRRGNENATVTNKDRLLYISYVSNYRLVLQPSQQTKAFLRGLGSIIDPSWLSMFNQSELQRLVGGDSSEIDVEDLRSNTIYSGLYAIGDDGQEHDTIKMFWKVMRELKDEERREVLKYVTSTPRAPLLGFSQLSPRFSIRDGGTDEERLPSTSTCVNLLKLPRYGSAKLLKSKLLYAVQSGAGFDLS